MIDEEREGLIDFILDKARPLIQQHYLTERPPLAMRLLWPVGQLADVAQQAEERLDAMNDQPDELAARKREKARVSAEDSERRLAELQDTGS
jgi:hypothetical protein